MKRDIFIILAGLFTFIFLILIEGFHGVAAQSQTFANNIPSMQQTQEPAGQLNLPIIFRGLDPTETPLPPGQQPILLACSEKTIDIPDNNQNGVSNTISINDSRYIGDINIRLDIDHTWISDLLVTLTHEETGTRIELINRPGYPADNNGCREDDIKAILDDDISLPVESECAIYPAAISGTYIPEQRLAAFDNESVAGHWTITVSDLIPHDVGRINRWCIAAEVYDIPTTPPQPPSPGELPERALITGVTGRTQSLPLDCESRSAVDWANYFGVKIDEIEFFHSLPKSDNPDLGFVGDVYGAWGQIPPNPYGVHAEPVAVRLRDYSLSAFSHRPLTWDNLRAEIAAGRPVIVWIVGSGYPGNYDYVVNGIPIYYSPKEGNVTVVGRYEHTVIVTGYSPTSVTYLNGGTIYEKGTHQFLASWSVLGNMAITKQP